MPRQARIAPGKSLQSQDNRCCMGAGSPLADQPRATRGLRALPGFSEILMLLQSLRVSLSLLLVAGVFGCDDGSGFSSASDTELRGGPIPCPKCQFNAAQ